MIVIGNGETTSLWAVDKKALAESIIGGGKGWLTEMTTADLRNLVKLRQ